MKKVHFLLIELKKTVKMKGKTYVLLSWFGWPSPDFDTLIPDSSLFISSEDSKGYYPFNKVISSL